MTRQLEIDQLLESWLAEGPTELPDRAIDRIVKQLEDKELRLIWLPGRTRMNRMILAVGGVAAVLIAIAVTGLYLGRNGPNIGDQPTPSASTRTSPTPNESAAIERLVSAVNERDSDAFAAVFAQGGSFAPSGHFHANGRPVFPVSVPVSTSNQVEAWLAILDAWGLDAVVRSCHPLPVTDAYRRSKSEWADPTSVNCDVSARWRTLSLEVIESWEFEFDSQALMHWGREPLVLDPVDRELPMGYQGLEEWEEWLRATDPVSADLYLNQREFSLDCDGCREFAESLAPGDPELGLRLARVFGHTDRSWFINGLEFSPRGFIPYDPQFADEIKTSIDQYLQTHVVSSTAAWTPPPSDCIDLEAGAYRGTHGSVGVTGTVPSGWSGLRSAFHLEKAPCLMEGSLRLQISNLSRVNSNACEWQGTLGDATSPGSVSFKLDYQGGGFEKTGPTGDGVTIAGYPANRFEFSVPADFDVSTCDLGTIQLWPAPAGRGADVTLEPGQTVTVYVVSVDGITLAVAATRSEDATPAQIAELDAIVASLRFEP